MLALSAVTVRAQSVTVFGEITELTEVRDAWIATIESDDGSTVDAMVADGIDCTVGYAGWFTVEMAPSELSAKYNYVTAFTELPEYGWEVGYMYGVGMTSSTFDSSMEFDIDGVIKKAIKEITIDNKKYTCGSEAVRVLRNNLGCIKYKVDSEGYIKTIEHISKPKLSVSNAVYNNGFEGLKYKITDSTVAAYPTSSDKNGFDGNGTIFLAVYRGTALDCVFTYKLQDGEQSGSEICQDVYYKPGTDWKNYSVVGYVWYDDMKPIYPSCPIDIDYR